MGIALIIVGGLTLSTLFAALFDYLGKRTKASSAGAAAELSELQKRVAALESLVRERDDRVLQIEKELSFMNKLLEDRSKT